MPAKTRKRAKKKPATTDPPKKTRLSEEQVETQLRLAHGNVAAVARAFGVVRSAVLDYVHRRPHLEAVMKDCRESMGDDAESALYDAVRAGEAWAVCFYLKTQCKARGYIERQEIDTGERKSIVIIEEIVASPPETVPSQAAPGPSGVPS